MPQFVALIRGINVGRAKRVPMAGLRGLLGGLGYTGVATVLNSGNAVFQAVRGMAADHARRIRGALASDLGVEAPVTVLTGAAFAAARAGNPLPAVDDPSRLLVAFPAEPGLLAELAPLARTSWGREAFALGDQAAYLWCADGILASALLQAVNRQLGDRVTTRNATTVEKVAQLLER